MSLERVEDKLDKVAEDISEIKITIAVNTASLVEHVKRTNMLEKQVKPLWNLFIAGSVLVGAVATVAGIIQIVVLVRGR